MLNKLKSFLAPSTNIDMTIFEPGGEGWFHEKSKNSAHYRYECRTGMTSVEVYVDEGFDYYSINRDDIFDRLEQIRDLSKDINLFDFYGYPYSTFVESWLPQGYEYLKSEKFFFFDIKKTSASTDSNVTRILAIASVVDKYTRIIAEELIDKNKLENKKLHDVDRRVPCKSETCSRDLPLKEAELSNGYCSTCDFKSKSFSEKLKNTATGRVPCRTLSCLRDIPKKEASLFGGYCSTCCDKF